MKRLAFLLGSLLVVSAAASAKEVVPAPVVVEEAPVQIVEKEVIVYRDKEEGFRPNGSVGAEYRYYHSTEGHTKDWNDNNKYSRLQLETKINFTENQSLGIRTRNFNNLTEVPSHSKKDETRVRYFYDHGLLGDSKVDLTSRVQYKDKSGSQELEYQARFNFADYMFNNDFTKTTDFTVAPKYMYRWTDKNDDNYEDDNYENEVGADLYTMHQLPWGFSFEFNVYATQHFFGKDQPFGPEGKLKDKNFTVDVEAYIYNTTNLYSEGKVSVDFNFEGGYDTYSWSKEKTYGTSKDQNENYSLYASPYVQLNYQATEFVNLFAGAGAEYRNWITENQKSATNWRWQPYAFAGFNVSF